MKKQMLREIREGINLEQNLPQLLNEMASVNHVFAGTSFLMQYYSLYEAIADGDKTFTDELMQRIVEINGMVRKNLLGSFDGEAREHSVFRLDEIRQDITGKMQVLTAYTDRFTLYEYMLNRQEPSFEEGLCDVDNDTLAREILQYIFMEKDNVIINERIHEVISQLPIRMSKMRFLDLVKSGMEPYLDSEQRAVDDFIYRVKSTAGLYEPEGWKEYFPELADLEEQFLAVDFSTMSREAFAACSEMVKKAAAKLTELTDQYYELMEVVNLLYAWLLNYPYASFAAMQLTDGFRDMLQVVVTRLESQQLTPFEELDGFQTTEGILEEYLLRLQENQGILAELMEKEKLCLDALVSKEQLQCLKRSSDLLGGSLFVELDRVQDPGKKMDREALTKAEKALEEDILEALKNQSQTKNRAMIAAVLTVLPVFFKDQKEVMDYVRTSLASCHDLAEKTACVRLLKQMMERE